MIERLEDVRAGDLFLGPIGGAAGLAVRAGQLVVDGGWRVGPLDVRHIGVVVEASVNLPGTPEAPATHRGRIYSTGVVTAPRLAQAMPGGAEVIEMRRDTHWTKRCAFARIPEDYAGQGADAAAIALAMADLEIGYSWSSYLALSAYRLGYRAPRLTGWIGRRRPPVWVEDAPGHVREPMEVRLPVEAICSVFADQAWSLAGKRVMEGTAPMAVTPSQLAQRLLFGLDGVEWGWPQRERRDGRDYLFG